MKRIILLAIIILVSLKGDSFALGENLFTEKASPSDVTGSFTLILYGNRHHNDVETVAFLDLEGDRYAFEPYAPEFDYRVEKGLAGAEALRRAEIFVGSNRNFRHSQLARVVGPSGETLGYEVRPLYYPLVFGTPDVLDVNYNLRDSTVRVTIRLKRQVERQLFGGDGIKDRDF